MSDHDLHRAIGVQGRRLDELVERVRSLEQAREAIPEDRIQGAVAGLIEQFKAGPTEKQRSMSDEEVARSVVESSVRRGIALGRGEA